MKFKQIIDTTGGMGILALDEAGYLVRIDFKFSRSATKDGSLIPCAAVTYVALDVLNSPGDYKMPPRGPR